MLQVLVRNHWVEVCVPPETTVAAMLAHIAAAPPRSLRRLLIDAAAVRESNPTAHALLADQLADKLPPNCQVALLVSESVLSYNGERVARRRGLNLCTFTERAEAEAWLLGKD